MPTITENIQIIIFRLEKLSNLLFLTHACAFGKIINASEEQIMESVFSLGLIALGMVFTPLGVLPNTNLTKTYDPAFRQRIL